MGLNLTKKRITLYSMANCAHCNSAKQYLDQNNISYRLVNIKSPSGQKEFYKTGYRAVPVLKIGEQFLNGFSVKQFKQILGK